MKNILKALCLVSCMAFFSCEDNFKELDKGNDVLTLTAPTEEIVMNERIYSSEAVNLTWTSGTNYGTGNRIEYSLVFNANGNTVTEELGTGVYAWKKNVEEFNAFLTDELGVSYDESVTIGVELIASVYGHEEMVQKVNATFCATTYKPVSKTLYIIGDATAAGYDLEKAIEMTRGDNGMFSATVKLKANKEFKFLCTRSGSYVPGYNRDPENEGKLLYRQSNSDPDEKFTVAEEGFYDIEINLLDLTVNISKSEGVQKRFDIVYFVGGFTKWAFKPMTHDLLSKNLWFYGAVMEGGDGSNEFKFGVEEGNWSAANRIVASVENAPYTSTEVVVAGEQDNKWKLTDEEVGKAYKIYLDVTPDKEKMIMTEFKGFDGVWMIGNATSAGWDIANAVAMTNSGNFIYKWAGELNSGELKFTCDKQTNWNGKWFMSAVNGGLPTGAEEDMMYIDKADADFAELYPDVAVKDIDNKWKIAQAGTYEITLNSLTHKVTIIKK